MSFPLATHTLTRPQARQECLNGVVLYEYDETKKFIWESVALTIFIGLGVFVYMPVLLMIASLKPCCSVYSTVCIEYASILIKSRIMQLTWQREHQMDLVYVGISQVYIPREV